MPNLYVAEQGARLERLSQRIVVRKNGDILLEAPVKDIDRVIVFGAVQATTQAFSLLLERGVDVSLLTVHGRFRGRLCSGLPKNIQLRLAQHDRLKDEGFCLSFATDVVRAKMRSQQAILKRHMRNHRDADFGDEVASITRALSLLSHQRTLSSVRAVEGMGAAAYFSAFARMVSSGLGFAGRNRRPSPDPVNGLLSLGYVLVSGELAGILEAHGLDPFMGFYHTIKHGRRSLALDVLEEFRHPVVDRLTLTVLNTSVLSGDDFEVRKGRQAYLKQASLKRYLCLYEEYLMREFPIRKEGKRLSFRQLFRIQVEKLTRLVRSGGEYVPFTME